MIDLLRTGAVTVLGRHPYASNAAYVVECSDGTRTARAMYKPASGERPLWDFPDTVLGLREVAAYELALHLGFTFVPPTVWRDDLPFGPGSLQVWVEDAVVADVDVVEAIEAGWVHVLDAELSNGTSVQVVHRDLPELRELALLDAVMNNGDRKGGHLLRDAAGALWAVDHGVTFHVDPKLRTVIWGFATQPIDPELLVRLNSDVLALPALGAALTDTELEALDRRMRELRTTGTYPIPSDEWPSIPWPIF